MMTVTETLAISGMRKRTDSTFLRCYNVLCCNISSRLRRCSWLDLCVSKEEVVSVHPPQVVDGV